MRQGLCMVGFRLGRSNQMSACGRQGWMAKWFDGWVYSAVVSFSFNQKVKSRIFYSHENPFLSTATTIQRHHYHNQFGKN